MLDCSQAMSDSDDATPLSQLDGNSGGQPTPSQPPQYNPNIEPEGPPPNNPPPNFDGYPPQGGPGPQGQRMPPQQMYQHQMMRGPQMPDDDDEYEVEEYIRLPPKTLFEQLGLKEALFAAILVFALSNPSIQSLLGGVLPESMGSGIVLTAILAAAAFVFFVIAKFTNLV